MGGITIYPANGDIVIPWDADISVKSGKLVLDGWAAPGDSATSCITHINLERVAQYLQMTIDPKNDESETRIREILTESLTGSSPNIRLFRGGGLTPSSDLMKVGV